MMVDGLMGFLRGGVRIQHLDGSLCLGVLYIPVAVREVVLIGRRWGHGWKSAVAV